MAKKPPKRRHAMVTGWNKKTGKPVTMLLPYSNASPRTPLHALPMVSAAIKCKWQLNRVVAVLIASLSPWH
jgi:hypothetical protein